MMMLLFHLFHGTSLVSTSVASKLLKIADISDVGFMKKFQKCGEWFRWIAEEIKLGFIIDYTPPECIKDYRLLGIDGSDVTEKGVTGSLYRLHYAVDIMKMQTVEYKITSEKTGEKLSVFNFQEGDLILGDRIFGTLSGINYVRQCKADCILRLRSKCFKMFDERGDEINIGDRISHLKSEEECEFPAYIKCDSANVEIRICVKKKSEGACEKSSKRIHRCESKKQHTVSEDSKLQNQYIIVATTLPESVSCADVLALYRCRWQVECCFKRMKSILGIGVLPKKTEQSSLAWLNGKLMIAMLIEAFLSKASFPPSDTF
jgi:hypothetical protein